MKLKSFAPIVLLGLSLSLYSSMLVTHTPIAHAQVDEARKVNWENAKRLYPMLVNAVNAQNRDEAFKLTGELQENLLYVRDKVEKAGQRLHPKDINVSGWNWAEKRQATIYDLKNTTIAVGLLGGRMKEVGSNPATELARVQTQWQSLTVSFDALMAEYENHGRELNEILKAFTNDCRECR
jgi:hypothetical protein